MIVSSSVSETIHFSNQSVKKQLIHLKNFGFLRHFRKQNFKHHRCKVRWEEISVFLNFGTCKKL